LRLLATLLVIVHAIFVVFVVLGSCVVLRWRRVIWLHVPAVIWGVIIEVTGWTCPLTPLENVLRERVGETGYQGGFIEHYLLRGLYHAGLTRTTQWELGGAALLINVVAYSWILTRRSNGDGSLLSHDNREDAGRKHDKG
jgi:hypothetical protein